MNNKRAARVMGMISLFPESHNQWSYARVPDSVGIVQPEKLRNDPSCGTTLCVAGWAAALYAPKNAVFASGDSNSFFVPSETGDWYLKDNYLFEIDPWDSFNDEIPVNTRYSAVDIFEFAMEALDLDDDQATWLFDETRTNDELIAGVGYLMANPSASSDDLAENC